MERQNIEYLKVISAAVALVMVAGTACAETKVYGHANQTMLRVDDGKDSYFNVVDNGSSGSRLGAKWSHKYDSCLMAGGRVEIGATGASNSGVNQVNNLAGRSVSVRQAHVYLKNTFWGTLDLGHSDAASSGAIDGLAKSNTWNTDYYGVGDTAFKFNFHVKEDEFVPGATPGQTSEIQTGAPIEVGQQFQNLDATRWSRVQYNSPVFMGLYGKASYGQRSVDSNGQNGDSEGRSNRYNTSGMIGYDGGFNDFELALALSYDRTTKGKKETNITTMGASFAGLHKPSGVSLNGTYATRKNTFDEDSLIADRTLTKKTKTWYVQLGWQFDFVSYGKTYTGASYFSGKNSRVDDDKGTSWALAVEQAIDKGHATVYASYRNYSLTRDVAGFNKFNDLSAIQIGLKVNFSRVV
jgi:hypothetical protein